MHLIQRMKIWKELKRLEERAREEPSPSTFVDLGQVYINLELADKAIHAAEDGLSLFPDSVELRNLREFARRSLLKSRIKELQGKITRAPQAKLYLELAQLHLDLGDHAAVNTTCEEWSVRFPADVGPWLMLGQARLTNFYRDLGAREGQDAVRCLEHVVRMDAKNAKAHRLLADVLYRIGAVQKAKAHLQVLQTVGQDDIEVQALLRQVATVKDAGGDVAARFHAVEERGALAHPPVTGPATGTTGDDGIGRIRDALAQIADLPGVKKATYIKGSRALVKGEIRDGRDPFLRVVRVVAKAAQRFARRMDIGNANKNVLAGPFGQICICAYGEVVAAVQCDSKAQIDRVLADLQELVAGSLYMAGTNR